MFAEGLVVQGREFRGVEEYFAIGLRDGDDGVDVPGELPSAPLVLK